MRSMRLIAIVVLAFVLAVPSLAHTQPTVGIHINKAYTNGDTTTQATFQIFRDQVLVDTITLTGPAIYAISSPTPGLWTILEVTAPGWVPASTEFHYYGDHKGTCTAGPGSVTIVYVEGDILAVKFTNSPAPPVGGFIEPLNKLALLAPSLTLAGLAIAVSAVVVVVKRRHQD